MKKLLVILSAAAILSGCVSIEYTGKTVAAGESDTKIAVFTDSSKITRKYEVLGQATARGNYQEVSRDRMISKLRQKAAESGANAILIVEQQVVPGNQNVPGNRVFMTAFDYDDTDRSWSQLYRDVDQNFVNPDRNRSETTAGSVNNFKRVIRAEFLQYKK